jgi:LuxR family transcriptional regulator, maltose regulon positive regulatory protein
LMERLNEGFQGRLTVVSAPAGFGKSTLVSEWIARGARPAAWLSLDEADSDPPRFLAYLVAALQTVAPGIGQGALGLLESPQPLPIESILTVVLNDITTLAARFVLVLDDYHLIDSRPIDQAVTFLLKRLPPQLHLVIASREDPQLPLAQLRARGQLTELRASDLRFTLSEAADFLGKVMGLNLSPEQITALETRTEGWIAGLQLAALALQRTMSMQGDQDVTPFINAFTGSDHFVMDYLVQEILHQQPESVQTFLLYTSILDRLCGPLCDAVCSYGTALPDPAGSGQDTLEYLEQANLFLIPLDSQRRWYRYHRLFADVLQARLTKEQPDRLASLHRRASEWYEQNDLPTGAIPHALAAGEFERAADLIEQVRFEMRRYFHNPTWSGWVKALPEEVVRVRPLIGVNFAWELLIIGELDAAEVHMRDAERLLEGTAHYANYSEELRQSLRASLALAWGFHAQALGNVAVTIQHARRAQSLLPKTNLRNLGIAAALLGTAYLSSGNLEAAYRSMAEGMASLQRAGNIVLALSGTYGLAEIRMAQGRLRDAIRIYEQALQLARAQGEPPIPGTVELHLGLSSLHREQGDLASARQHFSKALELGEQAGLPDWKFNLALARARIQQSEGDLDGALDQLQEAQRLYQRSPAPDLRPIAALRARLWVAQGRLTEALEWVRDRGLAVDDELGYLREFEHITLARILLAQYRRDRSAESLHQALRMLERLLRAAEAGERAGSMLEILVLRALAHHAHGDLSAALNPLQRALALAKPESYVRLFVDEGAPMARLLSAASAYGMMPQYTEKLLAAFEGEERTSEDEAIYSSQPLIEPLTQRELEVLHLLAEGLSNREIAARLFLALDTVKGHNRRIFGKLEVNKRGDAVARARELGLL